MAYLWMGVAFSIAIVAYFLRLTGPSSVRASRKAQQAQAMRQAYRAMESQNGRSTRDDKGHEGSATSTDAMKISQLWIYPIKSLRGCQVPTAMLTQEGFYLDRRFMLLKDHEETPAKLENMAVSTFARMCLFHTSIQGDTLIVTYRAPGSEAEDDSPGDSIEVPLDPESVAGLPQIPIDMHGSPTTGFDMGEEYGMWFSARFGFKVVLAFWGGNARAVLGNLPGRPTKQGPRRKNAITKWLGWVPVMGPALALSRDDDDDERIAFSDVAPYLVISETSVADVSARLPDGVDMDLTKFRANMVLSGAPTPFAEDYWGELAVGGGAGGARIILTGNCGRCLSLNVDYRTGAHGTGRQEQVLRLLQRDRRVDPGTKYSPVFGRYGFVARGDEGRVLRVGDEVALTRRNEARTTFYWPGLST